ncbi:HIT family protein [Paenibacillus pinihumi]|uniref:HIT family protein n=1 Tax=Paenibacillus pinihumi TaxID=669462 RepID=UPI00040B16F6|nr:HIT family protein [Paenibacillus pinihumi]
MSDCIYCRQDEGLLRLMLPVCSLQASEVYLFKDQLYPGRCVVALKEHKREMFELDDVTLQDYMRDVSRTAQALQQMYQPDKLNYAVYGDIVDHFHVHLVPKYKDGFGWGQPFQTHPDFAVKLEDHEYERICKELEQQLSKLL